MSEEQPRDHEQYFGKNCPKGKVQIEFVGVAPRERYSEYGWKPCDFAFLEIYIDGQRFRIDVGNYESSKGTRRGLHISGPLDLKVDQHSLNALDVYLEPRGPIE